MIVFRADQDMSSMVHDDVPGLVAAARRDPAAFGRLYERYVQPIYRYIFCRVGNVREAEDITSQTFMAAYESLARYKEQGLFSAWLFRIARSKMNDHFRRHKPEVGLEAAGQVLEREDALGALIRAEELSQIRSLIHCLDESEQDLLRLRYVANLSFAEIADLLGKREDAVKKSVYRLLARLKSEME